MSERKSVNKYYPPDFDPSKLPRKNKNKQQSRQMKVRMMLPMTIRCKSCGTYIYEGTKFNSRKEDDQTYLGIQIVRFYGKCTNCSAEFTIKTDPRNSDYTVESGAYRPNFEGKKKDNLKREHDQHDDAMTALEKKRLKLERETKADAAVDELQSLKSRHERVSIEAMLESLQTQKSKKMKKLEEEDEEIIRSIFRRTKEEVVCRTIPDEDFMQKFSSNSNQQADEEEDEEIQESANRKSSRQFSLANDSISNKPVFVRKNNRTTL